MGHFMCTWPNAEYQKLRKNEKMKLYIEFLCVISRYNSVIACKCSYKKKPKK